MGIEMSHPRGIHLLAQASKAVFQASPRTNRSSYRPDIDGLRAIAVLAVIIYHFWQPLIPGGYMGVDVFFVISGYVITATLLRDADQQRFSIKTFYVRRFKRIFPALIFVLLCVIAYAWFFVPDFFLMLLGKQVLAASGFAANVYFWFTSNYFGPNALDQPLLNIWSLGVEEQFYVVWPALIGLFVRLKRPYVIVWLLAIASLAYLYCLYCTFADQTQAFYSPVTRFWELSLGGGVAFGDRFGWRIPKAEWFAPVGAGMIAIFFTGFVRGGFPAIIGLPVVVGTGLVIHAGENAWPNRLLRWKPAVAVGLISYPLYLWHWPVLSFAYLRNSMVIPSSPVRFLLVLAVFALSTATYFVVERRFRKSSVATLIAAMLAVALLGVGIPISARHFDRPVDHDPSQGLVAYYAELRETGLGHFYREECNFTRSGSLQPKQSIDPSCIMPGPRGTYLLWGDSYAQALTYGLRANLPTGYNLAQVATSGCNPMVPATPKRLLAGPTETACRRSNETALVAVRRLKPELVILTQRANLERVDWTRLAARIKAAGARDVVVVGSPPRWDPTLPAQLAPFARALPDRWSGGLEKSDFETDEAMRRMPHRGFTYISLIDALCNPQGCKSTNLGRLMAVDSGHLSPEGSAWVGTIIARQVWGAAAAKAGPPVRGHLPSSSLPVSPRPISSPA